jgi:hypothetical protein
MSTYMEVFGNQEKLCYLPNIITHYSVLKISLECTKNIFEALLSQGTSKGTYSSLKEVSRYLGPVNVFEQYISSVPLNQSRYLPVFNDAGTQLSLF